jgi:hypothetical protein
MLNQEEQKPRRSCPRPIQHNRAVIYVSGLDAGGCWCARRDSNPRPTGSKLETNVVSMI